MTRRARTSILANPLLLGAAGLAVLMWGVYLAYNAINGLPFVPRYQVFVEVPNSSQITKSADVNIGGNRVGQVTKVKPARGPDGVPIAVLELRIDKQYEPIAADSTVTIRISGSLGRKYVDVTPGTSDRGVPDGGTLPVRQARPGVEIDELLNTFRPPVRTGIKRSLDGLGGGFAGRGVDLNVALDEFAPLLADLEPVMRNLADQGTGLDRFVRALTDLTAELAPVARQTAALFVDLDTTFAALARVSTPFLEETIAESARTFDVATPGITRARPFLTEATALLDELRPATRTLPTSAPVLADALGAGARNLPLVPDLSRRIDRAVDDVAEFAEQPTVDAGLERIELTATSLRPLVEFVAPAQTTCHYIALFMRNLASIFKEGVASGTTVRAGGVVTGVARNSERGPSAGPFPGPVAKALGPLHSNPYPNTASPGQTQECEAGHEPYITNQVVVGNVPGNQGGKTESLSLP